MAGAPLRGLFGVPFQGHSFEGIAARVGSPQLFDFAHLHWVAALGLVELSGITGLAGISQAHGRIAAQRHTPFFAIGVHLPKPPLRSGGADLQVKPGGISETGAFLVGRAGGALAVAVCEHGRFLWTGERFLHWETGEHVPRFWQFTPVVPRFGVGCQRTLAH